MSDIVEFSPEKRLIWKYLIMLTIRFGLSTLVVIPFMLIKFYINFTANVEESGVLLAFVEIIIFYFENYLVHTFVILVGLGIILFILDYYRSTITYQIIQEEIHVFRGILTKSHKVVPFRTITNLGIKRYPSDRLTGLSTIEIHTAGGSTGSGIFIEKTAQLKIDGLNSDHLKNLFDKIIFQIHKQSNVQETEFSNKHVTLPSNPRTKSQVLNEILIEFRGIKSDIKIN